VGVTSRVNNYIEVSPLFNVKTLFHVNSSIFYQYCGAKKLNVDKV